MSVYDLIKLREKIEDLEYQVKELTAALEASEAVDATPREWGFTPTERAIFSALARNAVARKETLNRLLACRAGDNPIGDNTVNMHICHMRKKLRPFGVEILTDFAVGFYLPPETRAKFKDCRGTR